MPKLRWDCQGGKRCFNELKRPKIEVFDECFTRGGAFGDVDAIIETGGNVLMLEFKPPDAELKRGQSLLYERLTELSPKITVLVVRGDPATMEIDRIQPVREGRFGEEIDCSLEVLKRWVSQWWKRHN